MQKLEEARHIEPASPAVSLPVSVIVPVRNEAGNLPRCLESLREAGEVYVIDSQSSDETAEIARSFGAHVVQFHYAGGWPKKRQWAMDTLPLAYDWVFLIDADEALTPELAVEMRHAIQDPGFDGYYIALQMVFMGRVLRHGGAGFYKLSLFRRRKGRFECRLKDQDASMADMEVHEHVIVEGKSARLKSYLLHHNVESLSRYIPEARRILQLGRPGVARRRNDSAELAPSFSEARPSAAAGCEEIIRRAWFVAAVVCLPVLLSPGIFGWRARPDLLRIQGRPILSDQSENLRIAHQEG